MFVCSRFTRRQQARPRGDPAFGETATGQNQGIASLYQYCAATAVIPILVSLLPPNRPDRRLRSGGRG